MKVKISMEVEGDDGKTETTMAVSWDKCDWVDVTSIQDVVGSLFPKFTDLGYALQVGHGAMTPEAVALTKKIARYAEPESAGIPLPTPVKPVSK
jgi:hypothetical protein